MRRFSHECTVFADVADHRATEPVRVTFVTELDLPRWRVAERALSLAQAWYRNGKFPGAPVGAIHRSSTVVEYADA